MSNTYKSLCFRLSFRGVLVLSLLLVGLIFLVSAQSAKALDLVVNSNFTGTNDGDTNPGDSNCVSIANGQCTLRAAVQEATASAGADIISVNVPGNIITFTAKISNISNNITIKSNNGGQVFLDCSPPSSVDCAFFSVLPGGDLRLESIRLRFAGRSGLNNLGGVLTLINSVVEQHTCDDGGCGIFANNNSTTILTNTNFLNNKILSNPARGGAAIYARDSRLEIYESTFTSNIVSVTSSASNYGGAVSLYNSALVVSRTYFLQNQALNGGGAIYAEGNTASQISRIYESQFSGNIAGGTGGKGGAISVNFATMTGGSFTAQHSTFINNVANVNNDTLAGSAIYLKNADTTPQNPIFKTFLVNNTFSNNDSKSGRGVIAIDNLSPVDLNHNTIVSNTSSSGRAGIVAPSGVVSPVVKLQNNILAFNSGSDASGAFNIGTRNLIRIENGDISYIGASFKLLIGADPKLSTLTYQGPPPSFTGSQSYRPLNFSPALNAGEIVPGLPVTDQTGINPRVFGGKPDLGSYEVQVSPPTIDPNGSFPGNNYTAIFHPGDNPINVVDASNASLTDPDSLNFERFEVTISNPLDGQAESLSVDTSGTAIVSSYNPNTFTLLLQGSDTRVNYQTVFRRIKYNNVEPSNATNRILYYLARDEYVQTESMGVSTTIMINFGQLVEEDLDNGQANQIGTLSYAINWVNSQTAPDRRTVMFLPALTQVIVQSGGSLPALASGSKIIANCTNGQPQITINGNNVLSGLAGLVLNGNNQLYGLRIVNFNSAKPQLLARNINGVNNLKCLRVSR